MIGNSDAIRQVRAQIIRYAPEDASVLVLGETGTGKGLVAAALHDLSTRSKRKLVVANCAAITSTLSESELFGHEVGAFTGAAKAHRGYFEQANNGTLLLDEIGDLAPELQPKVLRAIQDKQITRVGAEEEVSVDVRIVAATN